MHQPIERDLITCADADEILNISESAVYARLRKGMVLYELRHAYLHFAAWGPPQWCLDEWAMIRVALELVLD